MKDLYNESYNMLMKETEEDINEWRDILCMDWKAPLDYPTPCLHMFSFCALFKTCTSA